MSTIYRHNFSAAFMEMLQEWVSIHKYDENDAFQEHWQFWCRSNEMTIEIERETLEKKGCDKDIYDKMYKTVRYYLKNKSDTKTSPKKRRNYISLDKDFIEDIDKHIYDKGFIIKPQKAYENFLINEDFNEKIQETIDELKLCDLNEDEIKNKIKKTYKNRYFIYKKSNKAN